MANSTPDVVGIDFSGAKDAGRHIWISIGTESSGTLRMTQIEQASNFLGVGTDRDAVLEELVGWIDSLYNATVGIDFPFSVPEKIAWGVFQAHSWSQMVNHQNWPNLNPNTFRGQCRNISKGGIRDTDAMHRGDSPYSIRIYKQTFYGIRDVLRPLLDRNVSIAPIVDNKNTTILETYPAATLAREDGLFATRYKRGPSTRDRRGHNVQAMSNLPNLDLSAVSKDTIIDNSGGDALDSLVAALATFRASQNSALFNLSPQTQIEGHIFV